MAKTQKTLPRDADVASFIAAVPDPKRREDATTLSGLLTEWSGEKATLWGTSIVGFGSYHYRYESGREGDAPLVGFAARKTGLVVYLAGGFEDETAELLARLGPHRTGAACLYLKTLEGIDRDALRALVEHALKTHRAVDTASA